MRLQVHLSVCLISGLRFVDLALHGLLEDIRVIITACSNSIFYKDTDNTL